MMDELSKILLGRFDKIETRQDEILARMSEQEKEVIERISVTQLEMVERMGEVEKSISAVQGEVKGLKQAVTAGGTNIEISATGQDQSAGPVDNSVKTANTITAGGNVNGVNAQSDGGAKNIVGQAMTIWEQNKTAITLAVGAAAVMFQNEIKEFLGMGG